MLRILSIDTFHAATPQRIWGVDGDTVTPILSEDEMDGNRLDGILIVGEFTACLHITDWSGMVLYRQAEECLDPMPWVLTERSIEEGMGSNPVHMAAMRVLVQEHTDTE